MNKRRSALLFVSALAGGMSATGSAYANASWQTQPGCLSQIAQAVPGGYSTTGSGGTTLWGIGCGGGNQSIFYMAGSNVPNDSWSRYPSGAATQIAVGADNWPWVINSAGNVYVADLWTSPYSWIQVPNVCARSIAVAEGNPFGPQVSIISCTKANATDYYIQYLDASSGTFVNYPSGAATSISMQYHVTGSSITPTVFVTNSAGNTYEWNGSGWAYQSWIPCATRYDPMSGSLTACGTNDVWWYSDYYGSWQFNQWSTVSAQSVAGGGYPYAMATSGGNICYLDTTTDSGTGWCGSNF